MPAVGAPTDQEQHKHDAEHPRPMRRFLRLADGAGATRCATPRRPSRACLPAFRSGRDTTPGANGFAMLSPLSGMVSVPTVRWTDFRHGPANLLSGIRPGDAYATQMTANGPKPTRLNRMQPCMQTATVSANGTRPNPTGTDPNRPPLISGSGVRNPEGAPGLLELARN